MAPEKIFDVFISYSHEDKHVADNICRYLEDNNISYFLDKEAIKPASDWLTTLAESIQKCKVFLILISKNSFKSEYSMMELQYAYSERIEYNISILPYLIDEGISQDMLPPSVKMMLNSIQWISMSDHPIGQILIKDIRALLRGHLIEKVDLSSITTVVDMHCYKHLNRTVAGNCSDCGKFLCSECASKYTICICDDCYNTRVSENKHKRKKRFFTRFFIGLFLAFIFIWFCINNNDAYEILPAALLIFFLPYGTSIISVSGLIELVISLPIALIGGIYIFFRDLIRLPSNKIY